MNSTLYHGLSGIKTHQFGIDSTSNNISNINTDGYRANIPEFKSLFARQLDYLNAKKPVNSDFELGSTVQSNSIDTKEGVYKEADDSPFNMAIAGKGWLIVGTNKDGSYDIAKQEAPKTQQNFYTRAGSFKRNAEGYVVNDEGYFLYGIDLGKIDGMEFNSAYADKTKTKDEIEKLELEKLKQTTLKPLRFPEGLVFKPTLTTKVELNVNLNKTERLSAPTTFLTDSAGSFDMTRFLDYDMNVLSIADPGFSSANDPSSLKSLSSQFSSDINLGIEYDNEVTINTYDLDDITTKYNAIEATIPGFEGAAIKITPRSNIKEIVDAAKTNKNISVSGTVANNIPDGATITLTINGQTYNGVVKKGGFSIDVPASSFVTLNSTTIKYGTDFRSIKEFFEKIKEVSNLQAELTDTCNIRLSNPTDKDILVDFSSKGAFAKNLGLAYEPVLLTKKIPEASVQLATNYTDSREIKSPYYITNTDIYDESGEKYILQAKYTLKSSGNKNSTPPVDEVWEVETLIFDKTSQTKISQKSYKGELRFDADGKPTYISSTGSDREDIDFKGTKVSFTPAGNANNKEVGLSTNKIHDYSKVSSLYQDGNARGLLTNIGIDQNGFIQLQFSNNKFEIAGRVGIARFINDQGLRKVGSNLFEIQYQRIAGETKAVSGFPLIMWNNDDAKLEGGAILQGKIEGSNVEMSTALTELIVFQRGYSANAKSFTTGDELLKEAIQLKR